MSQKEQRRVWLKELQVRPAWPSRACWMVESRGVQMVRRSCRREPHLERSPGVRRLVVREYPPQELQQETQERVQPELE